MLSFCFATELMNGPSIDVSGSLVGLSPNMESWKILERKVMAVLFRECIVSHALIHNVILSSIVTILMMGAWLVPLYVHRL